MSVIDILKIIGFCIFVLVISIPLSLIFQAIGYALADLEWWWKHGKKR